jgi:hypothetical protein
VYGAQASLMLDVWKTRVHLPSKRIERSRLLLTFSLLLCKVATRVGKKLWTMNDETIMIQWLKSSKSPRRVCCNDAESASIHLRFMGSCARAVHSARTPLRRSMHHLHHRFCNVRTSHECRHCWIAPAFKNVSSRLKRGSLSQCAIHN